MASAAFVPTIAGWGPSQPLAAPSSATPRQTPHEVKTQREVSFSAQVSLGVLAAGTFAANSNRTRSGRRHQKHAIVVRAEGGGATDTVSTETSTVDLSATAAKGGGEATENPWVYDDDDVIPEYMVGAARWSQVEEREAAWRYMVDRKQLVENFEKVEAEWVRLACYAMNVGGAMELQEEKDELEGQIEQMREREQEVAEWFDDIKDIGAQADKKQADMTALKAKVDKAKKDVEETQNLLKEQEAETKQKESDMNSLRLARSTAEEQMVAAREKADSLVIQRKEVLSSIDVFAAQLEEQKRIANPRKEELRLMNEEMAELQESEKELAAKATKEVKELVEAKATAKGLKASIADTKAKISAASSEMASLKSENQDMPKELASSKKALEDLERTVSKMKAEIGPQGEDLEALRQDSENLKQTISNLKATTTETETSIESEVAKADILNEERAQIEVGLQALLERQAEAEAERANIEALLPVLREKRETLPDQVGEIVREARVRGLDLQLQAKDVQQWLVDSDLDARIKNEREKLSTTTMNVMEAARQVTEAQRKAEEAFQTALAERKLAEAGYEQFQSVMESRIISLAEQEKNVSDLLEEQNSIADKMKPLVVGVEDQAEKLDTVKEEVVELSKKADESSKDDLVVAAAGAIGWGIGNLIKASQSVAKKDE